jgi:hypothetical protein
MDDYWDYYNTRCSDCRYKESDLGKGSMENCEECYIDVCGYCIVNNQEICGERVCYECVYTKLLKKHMLFVFEELMEYSSWKRTRSRLKTIKEELMMMTWKVERVEPWCGESWYIE